MSNQNLMSAAISIIINSRIFTRGFLIGGVSIGFLTYGFGVLRGETRAVAKLDERIRAINDEKNAEMRNARGATSPENIQ